MSSESTNRRIRKENELSNVSLYLDRIAHEAWIRGLSTDEVNGMLDRLESILERRRDA